ncbi:hypothetical protein KDK_19850 [Dictyobacter kobayashii]|uniref:Uncharacterized protein n=1 Tax=Dictyobacter kobayashii TaxID=2014872 RepID=A0A402AGH9_9CHLR|nr:hypothetical protein KDK_19850 [Dictyobacter kobayashii]
MSTKLYIILVVIIGLALLGIFYLMSIIFHDPHFFGTVGFILLGMYVFLAIINRIFIMKKK